MNMFARFDENPAMTLQDIKETKRYGRTDAQTDVKTIYPTTNKVCGGYNKSRWILMCFFRAMQNMLFSACVRWIFLTTYINTTTTTSWATKASHSIWKATLTNKEQQNIIGRGVERDTMPDLSRIAQFHSGQVRCTCPGDKFKEIEYMCWYKLNTHVFISYSGLKLRVRTKKLIFLFLIQNICCGYSKELSHWNGSFEHPKHMIKLMGKKIFTSLRLNFLLIKTYDIDIIMNSHVENRCWSCSAGLDLDIHYL